MTSSITRSVDNSAVQVESGTTRPGEVARGSREQATVATIEPHTMSVPEAFVATYVTSELTDSGWVDALYVQNPDVPNPDEDAAIAADADVVSVAIGNLDDQLASLRVDINEVAEVAALHAHHGAFLQALVDDIGLRMSAGNHTDARTLLQQFRRKLESMVETGVLSAPLVHALTNPAVALENQLRTSSTVESGPVPRSPQLSQR